MAGHARRYGTIPPVGAVKLCETHGKRCYLSRKAAKHRIRVAHPGEAMGAYPCSADEGMWHIGHTPEPIVRGRLSRAEFEDHWNTARLRESA